MAGKDYSKLTKTLKITDMHETDDSIVLGGVAIPAERCDELIEAVEALAVEKFGGATFVELLDNDFSDEAAHASAEQYDREQAENMMKAAEDILKDPLE